VCGSGAGSATARGGPPGSGAVPESDSSPGTLAAGALVVDVVAAAAGRVVAVGGEAAGAVCVVVDAGGVVG
jgi:hypothetical protein